MYVNQLVISFVVFGILLYLMSCERENKKENKKENFYELNQKNNMVPYYSNYIRNNKYIPQNKALYYHPGHPYYTFPNLSPQPLNSVGDNKSFNQLQQSRNQFDRYNIEGYTNMSNINNQLDSQLDNMSPTGLMNPKVGKNDTNIVKITFFLMLVGLIYYLYQNKNSTLE